MKCQFKFQILSNPESQFRGVKEPHAPLELQVAEPWSRLTFFAAQNKKTG